MFGIHLANGPNPTVRILQGGFSSHLALQDQIPDLIRLKQADPSSRALVRYFCRNLLTTPISWTMSQLQMIVPLLLAAGIRDVIVGNELNNPVEGQVLHPDVAAHVLWILFGQIRSAYPTVRLHLPAFSPGFSDWEAYLAACRSLGVDFDVVDVHAYGTNDQMRQIVETAHRLVPNKPLAITEMNFGAGQKVDLASYLPQIRAFGQWCQGQSYLDGPPHWFIWRWDNPDFPLPTSVDVEGTILESFFTQVNKEQPMSDVTLPYPLVEKLTVNCDTGPRATTRGLFVHDTTGPADRQADYQITVGYFATPGTPASSHLVIGDGVVARMVHDDDLAWHAEENNHTHLGVELADDDNHTLPYTEMQYDNLADYAVQAAKKYGFPLTRVFSQFEAGLIGHEDSEQGKRWGKTDPGPNFDWSHFLALCHDKAGGAPTHPHPSFNYQIGPGFEALLRDHPDYGLPRSDAFPDQLGNTYVWTTGTPTHPNGVTLLWNKRLNRCQAVSWD